jgi:hypothetical protein
LDEDAIFCGFCGEKLILAEASQIVKKESSPPSPFRAPTNVLSFGKEDLSFVASPSLSQPTVVMEEEEIEREMSNWRKEEVAEDWKHLEQVMIFIVVCRYF